MIGVYFSGTGNTKYCIETFLNYLGCELPPVSIEDPELPGLLKKHTQIVFAYPIYFSSLPKIVHDFLVRNRQEFSGKKVFLLATMGLFSGDGAGCSARLLKRYGAEITGGLHLKMPDCIADVKALKRSFEKNQQLIRLADQKLERAARSWQNGRPPQEGLGILSHIAGLAGQRLWFYGKTRNYTDALKIDASACTGCGLCVKSCPMGNLRLINHKSVSNGRCTMCYRCITNCPKQAVTLLGRRVIRQAKVETYL